MATSIVRHTYRTRPIRRALISLLPLLLLAATPAAAWRVEIDGFQSEDDVARAIAVDSRGYIVAGGDFEDLGNYWLVVKLAPGDGQERVRSQEKFLELAAQSAARRMPEMQPPPVPFTEAPRVATRRPRKRQTS